KIKGIDTKLSEVGKLKAAMDKLRGAAVSLSGAGNWGAAKASSGQPDSIEATAKAGALPGSYSLRVDALAQHQSLVTNPLAGSDALVGGGSLTISFGTGDGGSFAPDPEREPVQILVPEGATLAQVRDAINRANAGVGATLVTDDAGTRLMIRGTESGEAQAFRIDAVDDGSGAGGLGLGALAYAPGDAAGAITRIQAASNAQVAFHGLALSPAPHSANDLLQNVSLTVHQVRAKPVTVDIATDTEAVRPGIDEFVNAYNELNSLVRSQTGYDPATRVAGPLQGNQTVTMMQSKLRSIVGSGVAGLDLGRLSDVRSEEHTSELQSRENLVCRLLLEKKKNSQQMWK